MFCMERAGQVARFAGVALLFSAANLVCLSKVSGLKLLSRNDYLSDADGLTLPLHTACLTLLVSGC